MFKLLGDKQLFAGDADLNKVESLIFPIIKILREESNGTYEYFYDCDLVVIKGNEDEFRIPIYQFQEQATSLLTALRETTGTTFLIPEIETFINSFGCISLKAKSSIKSDIRIVVHDQRTGTTPELGFSIKSQLGGASTLLNAGKTTNFIYQIEGFIPSSEAISAINVINTKSKIKDRIVAIQNFGGGLSFTTLEQDIFKNNLVLIDSLLPNILAEILKLFFTSYLNSIQDLTSFINKSNPLKFDTRFAHTFYEYKIKRFLTDVALGMTPSKVWAGKYDATGGYLVVKENGEVLCYHIYNRNQFEDYLFANTKLETPSSTRHDFGKIYEEKGLNYFKLNLQIRFI